MEIEILGNQYGIVIPMQSNLARDVNIKFKIFHNYGVEVSGEERGVGIYVEWQISPEEIAECLNVMSYKSRIIMPCYIQQTYDCIMNHRWQYIMEQLQYRVNQQCPYSYYPYHSPGMPFPSIPDTHLMKYDFFKFPTSSFYSDNLHPFWIEVMLNKIEEANLYLCFPLDVLKNAQGTSLNLNGTNRLNEKVYLILEHSIVPAILETCSVAGRMNVQYRQEMLQVLKRILSQQTQ